MNDEVSTDSLSKLLQGAKPGLCLASLHTCDRGLSTAYAFGEFPLAEAGAQPHPPKRQPKIRFVDSSRFPRALPTQSTCTRTVHHSPDAMGGGPLQHSTDTRSSLPCAAKNQSLSVREPRDG